MKNEKTEPARQRDGDNDEGKSLDLTQLQAKLRASPNGLSHIGSCIGDYRVRYRS